MKKIKILISCHKRAQVIHNAIMEPIQLGCSLNEKKFDNMLHDDDGDNISQLNPMYCELTAQYWAWKNLDLDYYGFCHYRRYFNFSKNHYKENAFGVVEENSINDYSIKKYGLDEITIRDVVENNDVIITEVKNLRKFGGGYRNVLSQYKDAYYLKDKDIYTIHDIIKDLYPEFEKYSLEYLNGHYTGFCNMYILKKDIFFHYCKWLFSILEEFCKRTDMSKYSSNTLRTPGHLSERLFGIFYLYLIDKYKNIKVKELQCVLFNCTEETDIAKPFFKEKNIPIVFAANNDFVPIFATCIQSILNYSNIKFNYDFILLHTNINDSNKNELLNMVKDYCNVSLRFINVTSIVSNYKLKANAHISVETYYRFLIQELLSNYKKILYLDCDIIVNCDISELYNINIDGYMLAAARDPDFLGQINGANYNTQKYCQEKFLMKDPYNYFQAGVLLLNNVEMKKAHSLHEWLTFASHKYLYNDQDVLNLYCEGRVKYIDMSWNLITDCYHTRIKDVISCAPANIQNEYFKARKNPKIIHYAGFMKPWHNPSEDFAHYFWYYSRKTPFYEELLYKMNKELLNKHKDLKPILRNIIDLLLPKGTRWREIVKKLAGRDVCARF